MKEKSWPRRISKDYLGLFNSFKIREYRVTYHHKLHWHDFYELEFILSGTGTQVLNGIRMPAQPGMLFLLTPVDYHEFHPDKQSDLTLINVNFSEDLIDDELRQLLYRRRSPLPVEFHSSELTNITADFRRLQAEAGREKLGSRQVIRGTLERILIDILRATEFNEANKAKDTEPPTSHFDLVLFSEQSPIQKALLYLNHHFRDPVSLKQIADHVGLSPHYFSEQFHKAMGVSFQSYLLEMRLQFARKLLIDSEFPVTEISFAAGFNTLSYFIRSFKQRFAVTPRSIRKGT